MPPLTESRQGLAGPHVVGVEPGVGEAAMPELPDPPLAWEDLSAEDRHPRGPGGCGGLVLRGQGHAGV
jgi:hypothetical protein